MLRQQCPNQNSRHKANQSAALGSPLRVLSSVRTVFSNTDGSAYLFPVRQVEGGRDSLYHLVPLRASGLL